jgi:aryl-alcohol dehydrogenase-like predicted oxidoreductase
MENVDALQWQLGDDEFAAIDQVSSPTQRTSTS